MRRLKYILMILGGIIAICVVIAVILLATFDDDDYRRLVTRTIEQRTGYKVIIGGHFSVDLSTQPRLSVSNIRFEQLPGGPKPPIRTIGRVELQLAASPLLSGTILVKHLVVEDAMISWILSEEFRPVSVRDEHDVKIPIFENVSLANIRVTVSNQDGSYTEEIILKRFNIGDASDSGRLRVNGEGSVNANGFLVEGRLGSLADALKPDRAYPVELNFKVADFSLNVSGTVDDLIRGKGLSFGVAAEGPELATLLNILNVNSPDLGALDIRAMVSGDIASPEVPSLAIRLGDEAAPRFAAQGSIADARTGEGTNILVTASVKNKAILQWLMLEELFYLSMVKLEGNLRETDGEFLFENAVVEGFDEYGLSLRGDGAVNFGHMFEKPWVKEVDVSIAFSSPTTQSFKPLLGGLLPDLGSVTGKVQLAGSSERLSLEKMVVRTDEPDRLSVALEGRIGAIEPENENLVSGVDLLASVWAGSLSALSSIAGAPLPDLGPLSANGRLYDHNGAYRLEDLEILLGNKEKLELKATGTVGRVLAGDDFSLDGIDLLVSFRSPDIQPVSKIVKRQLPEVGAIEGSFTLTGSETELTVTSAKLSAESAEELRISAEGEIDSLRMAADEPFKGVDLKLAATAPGSAPFEEMLGFNMPDLGPVDLKARVRDRNGGVDIEEFDLTCGPKMKKTLSARGQIQNIQSGDNISVKAFFETQTRPWMELAGREVPEDFEVRGTAKLLGALSDFRIENCEISAPGEKPVSLSANGRVKRDAGSYNLDIEFAAEADNTATINSISGTSLPALGPLSGKGRLSGTTLDPAFDGEISIGRTDFVTNAKVSFGGERPKIDAKVFASTIYVDDLGILPKKPSGDTDKLEKNTTSRTKYLFSETPFPFDSLKLVDLVVDLDADQVLSETHVLNDLDLDFQLADGILYTTAGRVDYTEGSVSTELTIDASASTPVLTLRSSAEDVDAKDMLRRLRRPLLLEGRVTIVADLQSAGSSPREIASALNGEFAIAIEDGKIRRSANLLALDALDLLTTVPAMVVPESPIPGMEEYTSLNCMTARFIFDDGIGVSEVIFLDTRDLRVVGTGSIDLRAETVDFVIAPKPKKRRLSITSSARVHGPLASPSVRKIPIQEAAQLAGEILAPYIFLPARGLGYIWYLIRNDKDERSPCLDVIK